VVYLEDNAGPHTETCYTFWIREQFELLGCKLALQAPQGNTITHTIISTYFITLPCSTSSIVTCAGPYTNVLDLSLFPSMSHRYSAQLQMYNNTEATIDKIWKTVENVWNQTSSSEVARAFVLSYRVDGRYNKRRCRQ
jgi:hypothetical protein